MLAQLNPADHQSLSAAWQSAWRPRPRPIRSEWCEQNIRLPEGIAAQPGPFSFVGREYQQEIIDAIDDPAIREIVIMAAPQVGKTELLRAIILSQGEVDAAPMMFAGPDQVYAREQRDSVYKIAEASPALRRRIPSLWLRNDRAIDLGRCLIWLAWSGSTQRLSGRSCKIVLCSEVDRWQSEPHLAKKRTAAFWRSCTVYEGSPIGESPYLAALYKGSDRRTLHCPCPHCGAYQEIRFVPHKEGPAAGRGCIAGMQTESGDWLTPEEARKNAYFLCRHGCRIGSRDKPEMIRRRRWVPAGQHCDDSGRLAGQPRYTGRRVGFQLPAILSPTCSFGDWAEAYLILRDSEPGRETFWNDYLGLPYTPRGTTPRWKDLGRRLAADYRRGTVPAWAYFLTGGADVQADRVYWVIRAWGDRCRSALIDFGCCRRSTGDDQEAVAGDLEGLDIELARRWPVAGENPRGLTRLACCRFGVDSGYRPTDVYAWVRSHPGEQVQAVAGDPKISPGILYRHQVLERNVRTGKPYPEGTNRWGIDTAAYKTDLQDRWFLPRERPGTWLLPIDILDTPGGAQYLRQITNERRRMENRAGRKLVHWEEIDKGAGSHALDCEVYARAMADQVVGQVWDAAQWTWGQQTERQAAEPEEAESDFSAR